VPAAARARPPRRSRIHRAPRCWRAARGRSRRKPAPGTAPPFEGSPSLRIGPGERRPAWCVLSRRAAGRARREPSSTAASRGRFHFDRTDLPTNCWALCARRQCPDIVRTPCFGSARNWLRFVEIKRVSTERCQPAYKHSARHTGVMFARSYPSTMPALSSGCRDYFRIRGECTMRACSNIVVRRRGVALPYLLAVGAAACGASRLANPV
jgi:hypothetical protein